MSVQASAWVIQNSQHKGSDLLCLLMIANHAHSDGTNAFPSVPTLAKECRMSSRQITRIIQNLQGSGELLVQRSEGRHAHTFTVVMEALIQPIKPDPANMSPSQNGNNLASTLPTCHGNPDISHTPTLPTCHGNPDISHTPTLTYSTFNPDISDTCIYDAPASEFEPSFEPSFEPQRGRVADAPPPPVKQSQPKPYSAELMAFWEAYPAGGRARGSQSTTNEAWAKLTPSDRDAAGRGLTAALSHSQFVAYPPAPDRWLKQRRWETFLDGLPLDAPLPSAPARPVPAVKAGAASTAEYYANRVDDILRNSQT